MTLAYLTYVFFDWLDRKARPDRKREFSAWLEGHSYNQLEIHSVMTSSFDRIYGTPLWGMLGFFRASAVSLILYIGFQCIRLFVSEESRDLLVQLASSSFMEVTLSYFSYILIFAISDYFSLLLVRNRLFTGSGDPIVNLLWVFIFGVALVFISYMILLIITYGVDMLTLQFYSNMTIAQLIKREFIQFFYHTRYFVGLIPPLLVHLWLLLFVIGSVGLRIIVLFLHATAGVQRIMGHPIRAIGMVAMIPVFFVGLAWAALYD